jgi:predicted pyridoxine 5'-phosphate oxidase superfamily flavin-nucleotide-binding protein
LRLASRGVITREHIWVSDKSQNFNVFNIEKNGAVALVNISFVD